MGEFFRGWRRKIGVVTLVTALVFIGEWLRSINNTDSTLFAMSKSSTLQLVSQSAKLTIRRFETPFLVTPVPGNVDQAFLLGTPPWIGQPFLISIEERAHGTPGLGMEPYKPTINTWGIKFGILAEKSLLTEEDLVRITFWEIPYTHFVIPLTILSAFLLLSTPRVAKQKSLSDNSSLESTGT